MEPNVATLNRDVERETLTLKRIEAELRRVIVGQDYLLDRLLVGLLARGHVLIEGVPGLAKTLAVKTLAQTMSIDFQRIQFTPDLLPADLVGTLIYDQRTAEFLARRGPVFTHLLLADEINRAPAKVQSALLESMEERQVTLGDRTYSLPEPFMVMATQNPIEQEGTYPLAEAQIDRFMMKLKVDYPSRREEAEILDRMLVAGDLRAHPVLDRERLLSLREVVDGVYLDGKTKQRLQVLDSNEEKDVIRNGSDLWLWDYTANTAKHYTIPAHAKGDGEQQGGPHRVASKANGVVPMRRLPESRAGSRCSRATPPLPPGAWSSRRNCLLALTSRRWRSTASSTSCH